MVAPVMQLTKKEIENLYRWKCNHGHNGIDHYNCWVRDSGQRENIGFLDIEASNLKANFGIILSYCIKPQGDNNILYGCITKEDLQADILDKRIVKQCIDDMRKFTRVIGHYSTKFDIPYIRTRALYWKLDFPPYGELLHTDVYYMAKSKLCLSSNRQDVIAETIQQKNIKSRIDSRHWIHALMGDEKSLAYILDHNKRDVIQLEQNYNRLVKYGKRNNKSI